MVPEDRGGVTRRGLLRTAGACAAGVGAAALGLAPWSTAVQGVVPGGRRDDESQAPASGEPYTPPAEADGGWRVGDPGALGADASRLRDVGAYHDASPVTAQHGGALVIIYKGHLVHESYVTGAEGGPRPWTRDTCNAIASSTKSVFGTGVGVFLDEFQDRVNLDTYLVGASRDEALVPQIWDQPMTDQRKHRIKVKHVMSMTSGHEGDEPWRATNPRRHYAGYSGAFQMHEYCFGWWHFEDIPAQHTLMFEPGTQFNYSNYGMEQMALAIRNLSGEQLGPYVYDRVLGAIGMPRGIRDNQTRHIPEHNFSNEPAWGVGGSEGCDAYGADTSASPYGFNSIAGATLRCSARDLARLGYLWLNKGRWGSQQLVPDAWMRLATTRFARDDGSTPNNYGYSFWILDDWDGVPDDAYSSRGFNVNDCYMVPSLDLVVARLGNMNPNRADRVEFTRTLLQKAAAAVSPRTEAGRRPKRGSARHA